MRLPPIPPQDLTPEQRELYDAFRRGIAAHFQGFETARADGALLGPFNPGLHEPALGRATWAMVEAVSALGILPAGAREIAILVTGARFRASYELYAHTRIAREKGLGADKVAAIASGQRPSDLTPEEAAAYDAAAALNAGGPLPEAAYDRLVAVFGRRGAAELIHLVGLYAMVSVILNGFDVPVPEQQIDAAP